MQKLRRLVGKDYPLALAGFPYTDYHPTFPYSVFLGAGGATFNAPQMYWHAIGTSVRAAFSHTYRWNRAYDRPIFPIGQTYEDPPKRELLDFRRYAREYGADGVSWWSWQETKRSEWGVVGRKHVKGVKNFEPDRSFAPLETGDAGDMVVLAQELLAAAGRQAEPSGIFDERTERAVLRFQADEGLRESGRIGDATWRRLIKREPAEHELEAGAGAGDRVRAALARGVARSAGVRGAPEDVGPGRRTAAPGAGPVALKRVKVSQSKLKGRIRFTVRNPLPPLRAAAPLPLECRLQRPPSLPRRRRQGDQQADDLRGRQGQEGQGRRRDLQVPQGRRHQEAEAGDREAEARIQQGDPARAPARRRGLRARRASATGRSRPGAGLSATTAPAATSATRGCRRGSGSRARSTRSSGSAARPG